jgi:hypothetical protein
LLTACGVELCEDEVDPLFRVIPLLEKRLQFLPRTVTKYFDYLVPAPLVVPDCIHVDRPLSASAALFADYVVQIVAFFHGSFIIERGGRRSTPRM